MKKVKFNFWLLGFGCGIILAGAVGTFISLSVKVPEQTVNVVAEPIEQVATEQATENKGQDQTSVIANESTKVEQEEKEEELQKADVAENPPSKVVYYVEVNIPSSSSASSISKLLEEEGVVDDAEAFLKYVSDRKKQRYIRSGKVELPQNGDYEEILNLLINP